MSNEYCIMLNQILEKVAIENAHNLGISVQKYIGKIVHRHLEALHSMEESAFLDGYREYNISDIATN